MLSFAVGELRRLPAKPVLENLYWSKNMVSRSFMIVAILVSGVLASQLLSQSVSAAHPSASTVVSKTDKDNDGTLDLAEVKAAASAKFDKLNKDADGTLDAKEVKGIIGPKTFKAADPDNDGTLTKDEYLALVEKLFDKADVDHDGTLSVQELKSKAARTLKGLID
jgi:Ca2+-binding EF-hand superfamily protein